MPDAPDNPPDELIQATGPGWLPPDETLKQPEWINARAFPAVWRESVVFTFGALAAAEKQYPNIRPGAPWRHRPEPESDADVDQAIAAKVEIGLRLLPVLAQAEVVVIEPELVSVMPEWDPEEEAVYAAEAELPHSPLFLDFESDTGLSAAWEAETWPQPFHLRGTLCWVKDEMLCLIPFGSVGGIHPWGGNDYQAWARWIYLQGQFDTWPMPGPGDFLGRASGESLSWVDAELESVCSQQGRVAYNLVKRSLMALFALERTGGELVAPTLPRAVRLRASRAAQKIAHVPRDFPKLPTVAHSTREPAPPSEDTQQCVVAMTHRRLEQVHTLWHEALAAYQDPDEFVTKINALITAMRSVTLVLKKEFGNSREFQRWYDPWVKLMATDRRLQWAKEARNEILKEGDLATHSTARVRVVGDWVTNAFTDLEVDPASDASEIARRVMVAGLPSWVREEGVLEVERRWTVDALPGDELLDVLAHCYGVLARIVAEAHQQRGTSMAGCELSHDLAGCGRTPLPAHPSGRRRCMHATRGARTSRRELSTGRPYALTSRERVPEATAEFMQEVRQRYGIDPTVPLATGERFYEAAAALHEVAKKILVADGYHTTIAWLLTADQELARRALFPQNQRDKYMMIEGLAEEADGLGADRLIFTVEAWTAPYVPAVDPRFHLRARDRDDRTEVLNTFALERDKPCHVWRTDFGRDGDQVQLAETEHLEMETPNFLTPFIRVWEAWPKH